MEERMNPDAKVQVQVKTAPFAQNPSTAAALLRALPQGLGLFLFPPWPPPNV